MTQCSICLSDLRDSVCIPCGHVYCKSCLIDYVNRPGNNEAIAKCPDCHASFNLVMPDLIYLPEKYHKFITPNVRRIHLDFSSANNKLREALKAAEHRLSKKVAEEQALLKRCEELTSALNIHRQGERKANERIVKLEGEIAKMMKLVKENEDKAKESQRIHGSHQGKGKSYVEGSKNFIQLEEFQDVRVTEIETRSSISEYLSQTSLSHPVHSFDDMELKPELLRGIYAYGSERPSACQQRAGGT